MARKTTQPARNVLGHTKDEFLDIVSPYPGEDSSWLIRMWMTGADPHDWRAEYAARGYVER